MTNILQITQKFLSKAELFIIQAYGPRMDFC
jgi:hypothetical protein